MVGLVDPTVKKHTCAITSISRVSFFTGAVVPSTGVVADGIQVAFVRTFIAFINIYN